MIRSMVLLLKVSRPGLWFATIWLYMLPLSQEYFWTSPIFWIGLFYVCFPLNLLVYGWNDIVDYEIDQKNPRKDSFLFGAILKKQDIKFVARAIWIIQLAFLPLLLICWDIKIAVLLFGMIAINGLYNAKDWGLRSQPPFEIFCQVGYLLIVPLSVLINGVNALSIWAYFYLFLFAVTSHLMGEVMDYFPDCKTGRKTTATEIGVIKTKFLILLLNLIEVLIVGFYFKDIIFAMMLVGWCIWLAADIWIYKKEETYNLKEMKIFGWMSNVIAIATMIYIWFSNSIV